MTQKTLFVALLIVSSSVASSPAGQPKRVLLLAGEKSHGPGAHEHLPGMKLLAKCFEGVPGLDVEVIDVSGKWEEGPELIRKADGIVMYLDFGMRWEQIDPERKAALEDLMSRGGGVAALHWAIGGRDPQYIPFHLELVGGCHGGPDRKYTHAKTELAVAAPDHPITRGVAGFAMQDEYYYRLKWAKEGKITPLLTATIEGEPNQAVAWAFERPDGGRSFGLAAMHEHKSWAVENARRLVAQAVLWTVGLPVPEDGLPVELSEKDLTLPGGERK